MPLVAESAAGLARASSRVCLIKVDGNDGVTWGTGFLVGPQVVLTAHHVIRPLLLPPDHAKPSPDSASRLTLTFDYLRRGIGREERVARDWLLAYSMQHADESNDTVPFGLTDGLLDFESCLDFAALRLARPLGRERGYYNIAESRLPRLNEAVVVVQHPASDPMRCADGVAGELWPENIRTRLPHDANTMPGSSGGIVLDEAYRPIGLHQGCIKQNGHIVSNVAVPTQRIASLNLPLAITEGMDPLWQVEANRQPVFGRGRLQEMIHDALTGNLRVIVITGASKSGRSFSAQILRQRVLHSGDIVVLASARTLPLDVSQLAENWLHLAGGSGEQSAQLPLYTEADSALPAWFRDHLIPAFMRALEQALDGKRLWIVLDDLDSATLPPGGTALFIEHLVQRASHHAQLRLMLVGGADTGNIPYAVVAQDEIGSVTVNDVRVTARLELVARRGYAAPETVNVIADAVMAAGPNDDCGRMAEMYRKLMDRQFEATQ
nr:serine protease [Massilia polaris]